MKSLENKKFKVGICSFAHMHAWSYLAALESFDDVEIVGIAEENSDSIDCAKDLVNSNQKIGKFYSNYDELINDDSIDCIIITTENCFHAELAIKGLEKGKHVIVEKPMCNTLEDADRMIKAADASKGILVQCYPCRYHPLSKKIKELFDKGDFGKVLSISATNHGQMPNRNSPVNRWFSTKELAGGGALMDHITHVADLIFWFTGAELRSIYATSQNLFHPDVDIDDAGMVLMEYDNDMKVSLDPSWSRPDNFSTWGDLTMTIFGMEKTLRMDMFNQFINIQRNRGSHPVETNYGTNMDELMMRDFINHLKTNEQPMLSGIDGKNALEVVIKAYESAEINKKIIL